METISHSAVADRLGAFVVGGATGFVVCGAAGFGSAERVATGTDGLGSAEGEAEGVGIGDSDGDSEG
ncbi:MULTISPECIES: hypothetical protein [unclassified Streptomyces]|uniref:hypothetical protein n=1 Tax=unclassified Streptomyces TaxID=2593676 RepID=UPI0028841F5E|nr:hypothetical protein [Streptomyces sp. DSM 41633]